MWKAPSLSKYFFKLWIKITQCPKSKPYSLLNQAPLQFFAMYLHYFILLLSQMFSQYLYAINSNFSSFVLCLYKYGRTTMISDLLFYLLMFQCPFNQQSTCIYYSSDGRIDQPSTEIIWTFARITFDKCWPLKFNRMGNPIFFSMFNTDSQLIVFFIRISITTIDLSFQCPIEIIIIILYVVMRHLLLYRSDGWMGIFYIVFAYFLWILKLNLLSRFNFVDFNFICRARRHYWM